MGQIALTADQAVQAIIDLINSRPDSPTRAELAAIVAKAALPAPDASVPRLRAEWDALVAEFMAADAKCSALSAACGGRLTDETAAAEDDAGEVEERVGACAQRILAEPTHTPADLFLLGEAVYWVMYCRAGLMAPEADAQLAREPMGEGFLFEAVVALLKGVRDLGMRAAAPLNAARDN